MKHSSLIPIVVMIMALGQISFAMPNGSEPKITGSLRRLSDGRLMIRAKVYNPSESEAFVAMNPSLVGGEKSFYLSYDKSEHKLEVASRVYLTPIASEFRNNSMVEL